MNPTIEMPDQETLLRTNAKVNRELVESHARLEEQLHRLGVDTKPRYTLSPPLGGDVPSLLHQSGSRPGSRQR